MYIYIYIYIDTYIYIYIYIGFSIHPIRRYASIQKLSSIRRVRRERSAARCGHSCRERTQGGDVGTRRIKLIRRTELNRLFELNRPIRFCLFEELNKLIRNNVRSFNVFRVVFEQLVPQDCDAHPAM